MVNAQDYYAFGMLMPGRLYSAGNSYRYGFNGKENDNEVKGIEGGQQDYGFRIYDPRLGKFLSVDPISAEYPELTPYQFASDNPILNIDLDGLEGVPYSHPRQAIYKFGEEIAVGTSKLIDKIDAKFEASVSWVRNIFSSGGTKIDEENSMTVRANISGHTGNWLSYVKYNNSNKGAPNAFSLETSFETGTSLNTESALGPVTVINKKTFDQGDKLTSEKSTVLIDAKVGGVPVKVGISKTIKKGAVVTVNAEGELNTNSNVKVKTSVGQTTTYGQKKAEVTIGAEVKVPLGKNAIKFSGSTTIGIKQ